MKNNRQRGITLIALIITVIIMLIIAGVAISYAFNNGLFDKVKLGTKKYEDSSNMEKSTIYDMDTALNDAMEEGEYASYVGTQKSLRLNKSILYLSLTGDKKSEKLEARVKNIEGNVIWESLNTSVATVEEDGNVVAVSEGNVVIIAKISSDNQEFSAACNVIVSQEPFSGNGSNGNSTGEHEGNEKSLEINKSSLTLYIEGSHTSEQLTVTLNNISGNVSWQSSDPSVASVSSDGTVSSVSEGTTTIIAKVTSDGEEYTATCSVIVGIEPVDFAQAFNSGLYTWDDMHDIAKIISSRYGVPGTETAGQEPKVDRTTEEVLIKNYKNSGKNILLSTKTNNEYNLVGKITRDGQEVDYTYKVRILGFNTDVLSSDQYGENYVAGTTRAGITFQFINFFRWDGTKETDQMNSSNNYADGWATSKIRNDLNANDVVQRLSNSAKIKTVNKLYLTTNTQKAQSVSTDRLWLLAASEVFPYIGSTPYEEATTVKYGMTFDAESEVDSEYNGQYIWYKNNVTFTNGSSENIITANLKKQSSYSTSSNDYGSGANGAWWLRSSKQSSTAMSTFCGSSDGGIVGRGASSNYYVSPGFCI